MNPRSQGLKKNYHFFLTGEKLMMGQTGQRFVLWIKKNQGNK